MILKLLGVLLLGSAATASASLILGFDQTSVTVAVGATFYLNADLIDTTPAQVAGFSLDVAFDPTMLQVVSAPIEEGYFAANGCCFSSGTIDNVNGAVSGIGDVDPFFGGEATSDTLVQIEFMAIGTGTGQITFQNPGLTDPSGNPLTIDGLNATDVTSTAASAPASAAPEPATWGLAGLGIGIAIARNLRRFARSSGV